MGGFQAIILVCLSGTAPDQCSEANAIEVLSTHVANELGCITGWQDVIARSAQARTVGADTYVRTLCRRSRADE